MLEYYKKGLGYKLSGGKSSVRELVFKLETIPFINKRIPTFMLSLYILRFSLYAPTIAYTVANSTHRYNATEPANNCRI